MQLSILRLTSRTKFALFLSISSSSGYYKRFVTISSFFFVFFDPILWVISWHYRWFFHIFHIFFLHSNQLSTEWVTLNFLIDYKVTHAHILAYIYMYIKFINDFCFRWIKCQYCKWNVLNFTGSLKMAPSQESKAIMSKKSDLTQ